ncbi:unnamed protein product, partial [Urochloa humidicola]
QETDTRPSPLNTLPTAIASRKKRNQGETNPSPSHPLLRRRPDPEGAMPLRSLARKMRAPATAALRRVLSPAAGAALRASHSSQNGGGSRAVNGVKNVRAALKDMEKWNRETVLLPLAERGAECREGKMLWLASLWTNWPGQTTHKLISQVIFSWQGGAVPRFALT